MNKWLFIVISAMVLAAIANNFYTFYIQKNYSFTVEASCDPSAQSCYLRDCSTGECPPNELETYRVFDLKAADFARCSDDSCLTECTSGAIKCQEIPCGESADDSCSEFNR